MVDNEWCNEISVSKYWKSSFSDTLFRRFPSLRLQLANHDSFIFRQRRIHIAWSSTYLELSGCLYIAVLGHLVHWELQWIIKPLVTFHLSHLSRIGTLFGGCKLSYLGVMSSLITSSQHIDLLVNNLELIQFLIHSLSHIRVLYSQSLRHLPITFPCYFHCQISMRAKNIQQTIG
jgi:hypothetical protein